MFGYQTIIEQLASIERRLRRMEADQDEQHELLMRIWFAVNRPQGLDVFCYEEDAMIRFGVILPVRPAADADWDEISNGRLVVTIPGFDPIEIRTEKGDQLTEDRILRDVRFIGKQGDKCKAAFNYIDNAGNHGAPVELEFELIDTVPPVDPTGLGAAMLEELPDPIPEPLPDDTQPIPEPEPTPDTPPVVDGETIE